MYITLRIDSNISGLVFAEKENAGYLWAYFLLTLSTIILFAVDVVLFVKFRRQFGFMNVAEGETTALGSMFAIIASACPICGSTLLSLFGATSGLLLLPFRGLEIKALSFVLMVLPIFLIKRQEKKACKTFCPSPKADYFKESDHGMAIVLVTVSILFTMINISYLKREPIFSKNFNIDDPNITLNALCNF